MRDSLIRLLIFLSPLVVLLGIVELRLHNTQSRYSELAKMIKENGPRAEIIALGSSHGVYNFIPSEFSSKMLNLSNVSQSHTVDVRLLDNFKHDFPNLKTVIVSVSAFSLGYLMHKTEYANRARLYRQHFGFWGDGEWFNHIGIEYWLLSLVYDIKDLRKEFKFFGNIELAEPVDEWGGFDHRHSRVTNDNISEDSGEGRARHHKDIFDENNIKRVTGDLRELTSRLEAEGIKVLFVIPPAYRTYTRHFSSEWILRLYRELEGLGGHTESYFLDPRFTKEDFYNNDHLNHQGATKFSKILDEARLDW